MIIYQRGVSIMSITFPSHRVNQNKGVMTLRCFWNYQGVDRRKPKKFREDPKVVQRVSEGVLELRGIK
jgi:hypothetical protein